MRKAFKGVTCKAILLSSGFPVCSVSDSRISQLKTTLNLESKELTLQTELGHSLTPPLLVSSSVKWVQVYPGHVRERLQHRAGWCSSMMMKGLSRNIRPGPAA